MIGHKSIESVDDPEICKAIQSILDSYHKEGRVFPHGQLRNFKKKDEPVCSEFDEKIEAIDEDLSKPRTIKDRYHFFRIQVLRNSWKGVRFLISTSILQKKKTQKNVKDEDCEELEETVFEPQKEDAEDVIIEEDDPNQAMVNLFGLFPDQI